VTAHDATIGAPQGAADLINCRLYPLVGAHCWSQYSPDSWTHLRYLSSHPRSTKSSFALSSSRWSLAPAGLCIGAGSSREPSSDAVSFQIPFTSLANFTATGSAVADLAHRARRSQLALGTASRLHLSFHFGTTVRRERYPLAQLYYLVSSYGCLLAALACVLDLKAP